MKGLEDITLNAAKFYKRRRRNNWRLNYHLEAPFGLVNDPNGLAQYKGNIIYSFNGIPLDVNINLNIGDYLLQKILLIIHTLKQY